MGYECRKGFPFQEFFNKNVSLRPLYQLGVAKPVLEIVSHLHTCFIIASNSDLHQNDAFIHIFPNICCSNPPKFWNVLTVLAELWRLSVVKSLPLNFKFPKHEESHRASFDQASPFYPMNLEKWFFSLQVKNMSLSSLLCWTSISGKTKKHTMSIFPCSRTWAKQLYLHQSDEWHLL